MTLTLINRFNTVGLGYDEHGRMMKELFLYNEVYIKI